MAANFRCLFNHMYAGSFQSRSDCFLEQSRTTRRSLYGLGIDHFVDWRLRIHDVVLAGFLVRTGGALAVALDVEIHCELYVPDPRRGSDHHAHDQLRAPFRRSHR